MILTSNEILELFKHCVRNAMNLAKTAQCIIQYCPENKYLALGLSEIALEEVGKSYSCLAYYSQSDNEQIWKNFWQAWKNHEIKTSRAFFYEFFCLKRYQINSDIFKSKFPTIRNSIPKEKEISFYVDFDKSSRRIYIPDQEISDDEIGNRILSLIGLLNAALTVQNWMVSDNPFEFKKAISDYAYITLSTNIYTQDVELTLSKMKGPNVNYNKGLDSIWSLFCQGI